MQGILVFVTVAAWVACAIGFFLSMVLEPGSGLHEGAAKPAVVGALVGVVGLFVLKVLGRR